MEVLTIRDCSELTELPFSQSTCYQVEQDARYPRLREICVSNCRKLSSIPLIPWTKSLCRADISQVGTSLEYLYYTNDQQIKYMAIQMGKDALDSELWNMLPFHNLSEIEDLSIKECPPMPPKHLQMLTSLKTLKISDCSNVLCPVDGDDNTRHQLPVVDLRIYRGDATGKEITQLVSYFPNLTNLVLDECKAVTGLGVAENQATATPAPSQSASDDKTEEAQIGQQQQGRGDEEKQAAAEGLLLLPSQIKDLCIQYCPDLRLCSSSLVDGTITARRGLQGLISLRSLTMLNCPKFLSSGSSSPSYCPFPTSLQKLSLRDMKGMFTLAPLSNLTGLYIKDCWELKGESIWSLLTNGHLTELWIYGSHKLIAGVCEQDLPCSSGLQELGTDGKAGILAATLCANLFTSITKLTFGWNDEMERFTKEQEEALLSLTLVQEFEIQCCEKLQSLPAGLSGLCNLRRLEIFNCQSLRSFSKDRLPSSLTELKISFCSSLRSLPEGLSELRNLRRLEIAYCSTLRSFPKDGFPSSLTELEISACQSLRSLPKGKLPSSLQTLDVHDIYNIHDIYNNEELRKQCRKLRGIIPIVKA
ncbi:hypothetical protein ACP4OV_020123 [Aristida adscensionis]